MELLSDYDFDLPDELIAKEALPERDGSRLMCLLNGSKPTIHDSFKNIGAYLREGDVLVVNNTKVRRARITAYKETGKRVEILLLGERQKGLYSALIKAGGKLPNKTKLIVRNKDDDHIIEVVDRCPKEPGAFLLSADLDLNGYADEYGELPLPSYMGRRATSFDDRSYQTMFAKEIGAVAAPTAGLHFSPMVLDGLKRQGVLIAEITLHVGAGTFLPIRTENIDHHKMHSEVFFMSKGCAEMLNEAKAKGNRIIPVGSTSMRVIEQVLQSSRLKGSDSFFATEGDTSIFIRPGYHFLGCDAIVTNFHTPRSTLLLLVSAVATRDRVLSAYREAIDRRYRFFSYGDACFFEVQR